MIWTNALLLDRDVKKNEFLRKFKCVCITCYNPKDMEFFEALKEEYKHVEIFDWELDDRLDIYNSTKKNTFACKRPLFEIPIDYHGNIHLCCMDWNNEYRIGNIFDATLDEIVCGNDYQKLVENSQKRIIGDTSPSICARCDKAWVTYPKYYNLNRICWQFEKESIRYSFSGK